MCTDEQLKQLIMYFWWQLKNVFQVKPIDFFICVGLLEDLAKLC